MGVVFRQSVKATAVTFVGAAIGALMVFAASKLMPAQELGFSRNLTNQSVVASYFLILGLNNTLFLYYHRFDSEVDQRKRNVFMSLCFISPLIAFVLMSLPYFIFQDYFLERFFQVQDRPFMKRYMLCFPLYTLFYLYISLLESFLLTQIKTAAASFVKEVLIKGLNLLLVLLYGFQYIDYSFFIYGFVSSNLIAVIILWYLARKNEGFKFSFQWQLLSKKEYKSIYSFAGYHALMSLSYTLFGFLDAILLAGLDPNGLKSVAVYTNAVFVSALMMIPYRAMNNIASADISKSYTLGQLDKVKDIYTRSALNIFIASAFMLVLIVVNLHNIVAFMPQEYYLVYPITLIMLLGKLIDASTGNNDVALNMSPYFKWNFYLSLALIIVLVLLLRLFIPQYGVFGAAWVFTIVLSLYNIFKTYLVYRKLQLNPFSKEAYKVFIIGAVSGLSASLLPQLENIIWDSIVRSIVMVTLFGGLTLWLKPGEDIRHFINNFLNKYS